MNATEDNGNDVVGETSFSYPDKIDADCIVERIPVVKRITSNKNKRESIGEISVDDEGVDVSSDEGDESSDESSSDNDETSNSSMDDSDDEADDEQRFLRDNTRAEERYEFLFNGKSNWIDESTRAFFQKHFKYVASWRTSNYCDCQWGCCFEPAIPLFGV